jgi:hypothetical protein
LFHIINYVAAAGYAVASGRRFLAAGSVLTAEKSALTMLWFICTILSKINKFSQHLREIQLLTGKIDKKSGSVNQCPGKTEGDVICLLGQKGSEKVIRLFSIIYTSCVISL